MYKSSYQEKAVTGVYWVGLMSVANTILKLLILMVLSRLLSPDEIGIVAALLILISFAEIFWMMGVGPAIVQKKDLSSEDIKTGNILNIIFGIGVYVIIFFFAPIISTFIGINSFVMLRIISLVFVIQSFSGVSESLLQKELDFKSIGLINSFSQFLYGASACLLALFGYGGWALIFAQIFQVTVKTVLLLLKKPVNISVRLNKQSIKSLMYFGTGYTLSRIFNNIANQGDYFVVNRTLGSSALGYYNRSYQLLMVPTVLIGTVIEKVMFPLLSKFQDKNEKLKYVYLNITSLVALVAMPITIISLIMGAELIEVTLGSKWDEIILPFEILITSLFFRMAYKVCDTLVNSIGAVYKRLWTQTLYAITIILGSYIGKDWGISGVAIATTLAIFLNYIVMTFLVVYLIKIKILHLIRYLVPMVVISGIIGVACYMISIQLRGIAEELIRLIIMISIMSLMYFTAYKFLLIKLMPSDFNEFVRTFIYAILNRIISMRSKKVIINSYKTKEEEDIVCTK